MSPQVSARRFDSYQQAGAWLRATFGAWADQLSEAEYEAVRYYASPAYQQLNLALRQQQPLDPTQQQHVTALDRALRVPLPEPVIAYRGLELEQPIDFTARTGRPLVFRGYVSTSLARSVAEGFCALAASNHHAVLFETVLPAGTPAGCPDLIQPTLEAELLLPRRQPFTLGEALPTALGRRYWTVELHTAKRLPARTAGHQRTAHPRTAARCRTNERETNVQLAAQPASRCPAAAGPINRTLNPLVPTSRNVES